MLQICSINNSGQHATKVEMCDVLTSKAWQHETHWVSINTWNHNHNKIHYTMHMANEEYWEDCAGTSVNTDVVKWILGRKFRL